MDAVDAAERDIAQGKEISLPEEVRDFVRPRFDESGKVVGLIRDQDAFDAALLDSCHFAIASSAAGKAREILVTYDLRPAPECRFDCLKGRMGLDTAGVHGNGSAKTCMALGFVAAVLKNGFRNACKEVRLDADEMLDALDMVELQRKPNGIYELGDDCSQEGLLLLSHLGIGVDLLNQAAVELGIEEIEKKAGIVDQLRTLPVMKERPGRGRIKGSKNRKTLEREAREAELREKGLLPPKRRPGRPKSPKPLEREAREAELRARGELSEKRGPGRPKGSKNRKTLEREARKAREAE